jgi:TonB family protein
VKPKLIFGALILGISVSSCNTKGKNTANPPAEQDDNALQVTWYEPTSPPIDVDSIVEAKISTPVVACGKGVELISETSCYVPIPEPIMEPISDPTCYEPVTLCYSVVEQTPVFQGEDSLLYNFIRNHLVYPQEAIENGIQGRVVCQFAVDIDGTITDIEILRSLDRYTDKEVVRLIKSMPKWLPGKRHGENVKVRYTLPITFKLQLQ